ncbi:MAG: ABC transporter permease [Armatimonadota bacterium]|nr:MAG: ABC transporter permease [Armatimonadota bacterium]
MRRVRAILVNTLPPVLYLAAFFFVPLAVLFLYSFWRAEAAGLRQDFTIANYLDVFRDTVNVTLLIKSVVIGIAAMLATLVIGYPLAYFIRFHGGRYRNVLLMLVIVCMISSYLVRVYAWKAILGNRGILNSFLIATGLLDEPLSFLLYSNSAVLIAFIHIFTPFIVVPVYSAMSSIDDSLLEASQDLGASPLTTFLRVTLPLSKPGIIGGCLLTFILVAGDYVTPTLVGGVDGIMIGRTIQSQFGFAYNWPLGSAVAFVMLLCLAVWASVLVFVTNLLLPTAGGRR